MSAILNTSTRKDILSDSASLVPHQFENKTASTLSASERGYSITSENTLNSYFRDLWDLLDTDARRILPLVALFLLSGCLDLLGLGLIGQYISSLVGAPSVVNLHVDEWLGLGGLGEQEKGYFLGGLLLAVFVVKTLIGITTHYVVQRAIGRIEAKVRGDLLLGYQLMPYAHWVLRSTSEYINAINVWVGQLTRTILMPLMRLVSDGFVACLILLFFAYIDWRAFVVFLALLVATGVFYDRVVRERIFRYGNRFRKLSVDVISDVRHAMDGFKEIRVVGAEKHFNDRIRKNADELCANMAYLNTYSQIPRYLIELMIVTFAVVTVSVTTALGEATGTLIPVFGMFAAGAIRLAPLASLASSVVTNNRFYRDSISVLARDYRDAQRAQQAAAQSFLSGTARKFRSLETRNLWFAYEQSTDWALKDVNISIRAGETIVFVGPSGAGKTTLVDILLGLLEPAKGEVIVNGVARLQSARILRDKVAYLPQHVFLIDDTLRRNIALGEADDTIDDRRVLNALRRAKLDSLVKELPDGLDGMIGDRGLRLSGGQRQRLALSRAFYFERDIIVLDEPTSAIDQETEKVIIDEIMALCREKTLIAITHRPSVTRRFQKVYRITKGKVILEKGRQAARLSRANK